MALNEQIPSCRNTKHKHGGVIGNKELSIYAFDKCYECGNTFKNVYFVEEHNEVVLCAECASNKKHNG